MSLRQLIVQAINKKKLTSTSESTSSKRILHQSSDTKSVASTSVQNNELIYQQIKSTASNTTSQSTAPAPTHLKQTSTTSTSTAPVKLRTFSRLAMSTFASTATTSAVTASSRLRLIKITSNNI